MICTVHSGGHTGPPLRCDKGVFLYNLLPERSKCQTCQFEMLHAERNANNRDAEEHSEYQMRETDPYPTHEYPNDIHQYTEAAAVTGTTAHLPAKGAKSQHRQLQGLKTERNADDGDHQQQAGNNIFHADQKSAANQPNNIE